MTWNSSKPALGNQIANDIPDIEENFNCLGPYVTLWIDSDELKPSTTAPCATVAQVEQGTNDVDYRGLNFDPGGLEYAFATRVMPENWNRSTVKAKFYWSPAAGATAGDVVRWEIWGTSITDDDLMDVAWGTSQVINDTVLAGVEADLHVSDATPALTVGGTPGLNHLLKLRVARDAADAADTMDAEDAILYGVLIQYTINEEPAAW